LVHEDVIECLSDRPFRVSNVVTTTENREQMIHIGDKETTDLVLGW